MVQGDAYNIGIAIRNNGEALESNDGEAVEVSLL